MENRCYKMPKNTEAFDNNKLTYDINYKKLHLPNKLGLFLHKAAQRHRENTQAQMALQKQIHTTLCHKYQRY